MRKWFENIDWGSLIGAALVLLFFLSVLSPLPQNQKNAISEHQQQSEGAVDHGRGLSGIIGFIDRNRDDINASSTLAITFLTLALVIVGYTQSNRLRETINVMDRTAERQLRAYVLVSAARIENVDVGKVPIARITIKNFGQTPAYDLTQWSIMGFDHFPARVDPPMEERDEVGGTITIGPNGEIFADPAFSDNRNPRVLTAHQVDGLRRGEVAIYVYGQIKYRDGFDNDQFTEYFFFAGGPIGIGNGNMAPYHKWNKST